MTEWPVLASLPPHEIQQIMSAGRRRRFARGETLFHYGDPADCLHLLDSGRVAVRVLTPQGEQAILTVLGPGTAFGELALIDGHSLRTASVTAIQACETIVVQKVQFERLRATYPGVDRFLLASLSAQIARLSDQLLEVLFVPIKLRIMRRLLALGDEFEGVIPLTQEDIALMAGTTRPTVNEILRDFERSGAISIGRGRIEVVDRRQLDRRLARAQLA
jgi:CRP/FNR family cyclic AMP-dependent transcriptional regulator